MATLNQLRGMREGKTPGKLSTALDKFFRPNRVAPPLPTNPRQFKQSSGYVPEVRVKGSGVPRPRQLSRPMLAIDYQRDILNGGNVNQL